LVFATVVCRAAAEDPKIMGLTGPVYQLLARPFSLLRPELIARVIYAEIRRRLRRTAPLPPPEDSSAIYLPAPNTPASTPPQWRNEALPEPAAVGTRVGSGA
jgi:hypothetical protein